MLLLEGQGGQIILSILITLETNHQRPEAKIRWMSSWGSKATFLFHIKTTSTSDTKANKDPSNNKTSKPKNSTVIFIMWDKWTRCYNICLNVTSFCSYVQDLLLRKEEVGHQFHNAFNLDWCVQARQQQEFSRINTEHNSFGRNLWNVNQISHYKHSRVYTHTFSQKYPISKNKLLLNYRDFCTHKRSEGPIHHTAGVRPNCNSVVSGERKRHFICVLQLTTTKL